MGYPLDLRGRAPRGERLHATQPTAPGKRISTIGTPVVSGVENGCEQKCGEAHATCLKSGQYASHSPLARMTRNFIMFLALSIFHQAPGSLMRF